MSTERKEANKFSRQRQRAQTLAGEQPQDWNDYSPQELQRLIQELKAHQIELELQNEELRLAQLDRELAQKKYAELYDSAPLGYVTLDEHGLILEANLTGAEMLGQNREEVIGQRLSRFVAPEDQDAYHLYQQQLSKTEEMLRTEISLLQADGSQFYARLHGRRVMQPGEVEQYRIIISDITERVQAEQAWQEAHHFISAVLDTAGALIIVMDRQAGVIRFNRACEQLSGYSFEEMQGRPIWDLLVPPEERASVLATFEQLRTGQFPNELENHWVARDGSRHLISWSNTALPDPEGMVQYVVGIGIDVTQRKEAEEAYRTLVDHSLQGLAIFEGVDQGFRLVFANPGLSRIGGYSTSELMAMGPNQLKALIHPEDRDWVWEHARDYLVGKVVSPRLELRFFSKAGGVRWVEGYANPIVYRGKPALQIAFVDVTERKQAEEKLKENEARLEGIINTATDAIITLEAERRSIILFNAAAEQMFGYKAAEIIGQPIDLLLPERFRTHHTQHIDYFGQTGITARSMGRLDTLYGRRANGQEFPIEVMISQVEVAGRKLYTAIARDITERKQAEEVRAYLAVLVDSSDDAIIGKTMEGKVASWNQGAERLYGYRAEEMIGHSITRIFPPERYDELPRMLARIQQGESIKNYETQRITKDGRRLIIVLTLSPIRDATGRPVGASVIARDITVRKRTELELAQLLETVSEQREQLRAVTGQLAEAQEAERKALARELHDQVGQKLTALNLNLNALRTRLVKTLATPEPLMAVLEQSLNLVEETTERIQNVMADLRPPMLDDYGLLAALRWYGAEVAAHTNFEVVVQGKEPEPRLPAPVEHTLFRITQEALTNVVKHALATQVTITLKEKHGMVRLIIADDGRGFSPSRPKPGERHGWGLLTMAERAEAVGGQCQIKSRPGRGTQVTVEVAR